MRLVIICFFQDYALPDELLYPPWSRSHVQDDRARFDIDELLQNAVLHWIEIIGEAARGVSDKVRDAYPEVPWRVIIDMRNRVSHGYFDIDLDVVWNTGTRCPSRTAAIGFLSWGNPG